MQFKDYYATLGVARDAVAADIKKAFRKLARKYHPDVSKEKNAEAQMKEVNEAYGVLSDAEKRAAYDEVGQGYRPGQEFSPPPDWDAGFEFRGDGQQGAAGADFGSFFEEMLGRAARERHSGPGARSGARFQARGEDHHAKVLLDIEDAFKGATRQISLRVPHVDAAGHMALDTRTLQVRIPAGVAAGQLIRLAGQGGAGFGGGAAGDLLLEVQFHPHARWRLDGRDVSMTLPAAPWECALGAQVEVALPGGGAIEMRIPVGAQSGAQLRVRGKGLPGDPPGDLLLRIEVRLPPATTPRARELYETMARELAFDARADGAAEAETKAAAQAGTRKEATT